VLAKLNQLLVNTNDQRLSDFGFFHKIGMRFDEKKPVLSTSFQGQQNPL
jgi:hypothetical protein